MFKLRCLFLGLLLSAASAFSQPVISNVDKTTGVVNSVLEISGTGFGTNAGLIKVAFGPVYGNVISVNDKLVKVEVPPGATVENITVADLASGLTASFSAPFILSFGGSELSTSVFSKESVFKANSGINENCLCDVDNDGKVDMILTSDDPLKNSITLFKNESTPGNASFIKTDISINAPTTSIACDDLDGDGKKDIVAAKSGGSGDQVFVLRNTTSGSAISFSAPVPYFTTGNFIKKVILKDLDKDGRVEIISSSESGNTLSIFRNTSTVGTVSFEFAPLNVIVEGASSTTYIVAEDLNDDGFAEILVNSFLGQQIFVLRNTGTSNTISFAAGQTITVKSGSNNLFVTDLDFDNKKDLVITNFTSGEVGILKNNTSSENIVFSEPIYVTAVSNAWGIDAGDLDGDGKIDLAVASTGENSIALLRNTTSGETISFERVVTSTSEKGKSIKIGDLDHDGKPDIGYTGIDNSNFVVALNQSCIKPLITTNNAFTICKGTPLRLEVPQGIGLTYQWYKNDEAISGADLYSLDVNESGNYKVRLVETLSQCNSMSEAVTVSILDPDAPEPQIFINTNGITEFCEGDSLILEVEGDFFGYQWNNGATSKSITAKEGGLYSVVVQIAGGCSISADVEIIRNDAVNATIFADKLEIFKGESIQLTASGGEFYKWENNPTISDINVHSPMVTPLETTTYRVTVSDSKRCEDTAEITIELKELNDELIPLKIFSPNNDGIQEFWVIENIENKTNYKVTIYARSGKKLFEASPYNNNWDGTVAGEKQPQGDYYYVIKDLTSGKSITGSLLLIR